jgi:hypothetical protein
VTASTGTVATVLSTSPTLVTPILGTPTSGTLSNCDAGTATAKGVLELATDDESKTGTDTARAVTPANLRAAVSGATTVTTTYTTLITDSVIYGNHATTGFTITLLAAATAGANKRYTIANINAALVTVEGDSTDELIGGLVKQCIGQNEAITIDCDGSNWHIVHDARVKNTKNELTNSLLSVWSNSEDLYTTAGDAVGDATVEDATDLIDNGNMGTWTGNLPTGWSLYGTTTDGEISEDVGKMSFNVNAASEGCLTNTFTTETGKLYEFTGSFTKVTGNIAIEIRKGDDSGFINLNGVGYTLLAASDTTYTIVYEETAGGAGAYTRITSSAGAANWTIDKVQVHEVTPGIVSATADGPDGWSKVSNIDIYREHNGSNTKDGSFYALKLIMGGTSDSVRYRNTTTDAYAEWYQRFAGRTVTFGSWVWAEDATTIRLKLHDGVTATESSYHTGGSSWEWLEVTKTVSDSPSKFSVIYDGDAASGTEVCFVSQPMLVFGSSIGEGNYVAPVGEVVWLESGFSLTDYQSVSVGATDDTILDLEAQSDGKLPKGAMSAQVTLQGKCAGTVGDGFQIALFQSSTNLYGVKLFHTTLSVFQGTDGGVACDSNGDIYLSLNAAWTTVRIKINAVQVS